MLYSYIFYFSFLMYLRNRKPNENEISMRSQIKLNNVNKKSVQNFIKSIFSSFFHPLLNYLNHCLNPIHINSLDFYCVNKKINKWKTRHPNKYGSCNEFFHKHSFFLRLYSCFETIVLNSFIACKTQYHITLNIYVYTFVSVIYQSPTCSSTYPCDPRNP